MRRREGRFERGDTGSFKDKNWSSKIVRSRRKYRKKEGRINYSLKEENSHWTNKWEYGTCSLNISSQSQGR